MKNKKILISGIIIISIIMFILLSAVLFMKNSNKKIAYEEFSNDIKRAMSYNEITDADYNIDNCDYVRFNAFFIRDLDGDGYAEKYDGTCNYIDKTATLYFDINVLTDGKLENGKITINGRNFNLSTALVKDDVLKNDYIGSNVRELQLNTINYGTQKLFSGRIVANIMNNINNYSIENNTVTLTGTWVSTDGSQSVNINKVINLKADWYGKTSTSVYSYIDTTHDIANVVGTEDVTFDFTVGYRETAEELLLQKQITEVKIPDFNGYAPTEVTVTSQNCNYEYNEETRLLTITRDAIVNDNGNITNSISRINTYNIKVKYPLEAYEALGSDTISITFPTTGYYYGYNNSSEEFSDQNPYISSASKSWTHTWRVPTGNVADFEVSVGKYTYNSDTNTYRYIISKELPLNIYNNLGQAEDTSDEYIVQWRGYTGNTFADQNGIYMEETQEDRFLDSSGNYTSMKQYIKTKGIYFSNVDGILSEDGYIKIFDNSTNELLATFTKENWNEYSSQNPYYFDKEVKGIKVETSKANENSYFYVYQVKEIDDEKLTTDFTYEQFENLNYIYSYLRGGLFCNTTKTEINTDQGYAYYEAPVSIARFSVNPSVITNQETKNIDMKIITESQYYNESKWKNGKFVIELPEQILDVVLNSVTSDNSNVEVTSYENYEENGKQYIKIYTKNEEECSFGLTINADVTADPRNPTINGSVKLYAENEACKNYRTTSRTSDVLDINGNKNTDEYILYKTASLQIVAPSSLLTSQTLSNFDDSESEVVSPQIAILDKSNNSRDAKVNISVTNNYAGTISETKIVGKIAFEGNKYQINGKELGSTYSVKMKEGGIVLPDVVSSIAKVYYSENEIVTEDITDASNNWKTSEEVTNWNNIKTYVIDLSDYVLKMKETLTFTYDIEVPANINYNDVTYSTHAVYFCLDTEDGKLKTNTEVNRLGIMIAKKYDMSLTKYKNGTNTKVNGATYKVTDGTYTRTGITDENGNLIISGLYADKEYTLKEIQTPDSYILNEDEIKFKLTVDEEGNPQINIISGTLRDTAEVSNIDGKFVVNLNVQDIAKYDVKITKTDSVTAEKLKGVKFRLTGGIYGTTGRIFTTNSDGEISMINLVPDVEYKLQETRANGYYVDSDVKSFRVSRNSSGNLVITSDDTNIQNASIVEQEGVDKAVINVSLTNEAIPTYSLDIFKKNDKNEPLAGTQFKITSIDTGDIYYLTTDAEGKANLPGLYCFVEGEYITGEYILQEIAATEGYITNNTQVIFKAQNQSNTMQISILQGEDAIVSSSSNETSITLNFDNKPIFNLSKTGDNNELLSNAKFKITDLDGNYVQDINGNTIGELVGQAPINVSFTSTGTYTWSQREDGTWQSSGNYHVASSTSTLTSNNFILPEDATLSFDWSVSSESASYDYVYYTITNVDTNETIGGTSTKIGGTTNGTVYESLKFTTVSVDLQEGKYKIEFVYRKDGSADTGLDAGFVRNVKVSGSGYYALTTDEKGEITANLPEGLYKVIEVEAPEGYDLPENEDDRTYYVGIGQSRPEEKAFDIEFSKSLSGSGFTNIHDIKSEADGGYIVAGSVEGQGDLNGDSIAEITSKGDLDALIVKYDKSGNLEWYKSYGDIGADEFYSISLTSDGGYIVSGYESTENFEDGIIMKLDSSGNQVWKNNVVGELRDEVRDVTVLSTGDIVAVGRFYSTSVTLAPSITISNSGKYDGFIVCYGQDGSYKWSNSINGSNNIDVSSVTETSRGVVVSANFLERISINGSNVTAVGSQDSVLIAYSLTGGYQWYQVIGGSSDESIEELATDSEDNIIGVGAYASNFTLGTDNLTVSSTEYASALAVKYSSIGEYISNYNFGGTVNYDDKLTSVVATDDGGVLLGGWFYSNLDIDGDGTNDYTNSTTYGDGIVVKLNDAWEFEWSRNVAGSSFDSVQGVTELDDMGFVAVGNFDSNTISSGASSGILTKQGYNDSFMIKLANVVTQAEIPQLQEINVTNKLKEFKITTEIAENSDGERAGGTITGTDTPEANIKFVENVKYGYDSTNQIVITPSTNYSIYKVQINGEEIDFIADENGVVTLPVFEDVKEDYHIKVVFEKNLSSILVHHYLKDRDGNYTTTKLAEDEYFTGKIGASYTTSPKIDIEGYELERSNDNSYVIPNNSVGNYQTTQVVINYYYEEVPLNLTVHHYLEGTQNSLADDESYSKYKGEEYSTSANSTLLESYDLVENLTTVKPETAGVTGVLNQNTIVTYYYRLKEHNITTKVSPIKINIFNENTGEVEEIEVNGGSILGENEAPYEEVIHGNDSTKLIKAIPETGFRVKSITVNGTPIEFEENSDKSVTLNNFINVTEDKEVVVEFEIVAGTVTVHHYIEGTTTGVPLVDGTPAEDEIKSGYVGNPYATKPKDDVSQGYVVVSIPDNSSGTIEEGNKEVTYYYKKRNDLSYKVNYLEKGTNKVLHEQKVVDNQTFETEIISANEVITIDGYNYDSVDKNKLTITANNEENVINIYYTKKNDLSYTVNYLEKGTNKVLHDPKVAENVTFDSVITSADEVITIDGYKYDSVDKDKITITIGDNVINIYYTKKNDLSYTVNYLEKGTNKVLHEQKVTNNQVFGTEITSSNEVITIDGYNYNSVDKDKLTITTGENVVNIYYTKKNDLSYTVNYLEKGTNKVLHDPKVAENVTFDSVITSADEVITIDGYKYDSVDKDKLTITTGENVINIYYTKKKDLSYTVNYLEKDTNKVLHDPKVVNNQTFETVITSADEIIEINGHNYDSVDKDKITITTGENVINIYYTKKNDLSYKVNYLEKETNKVLHEQKVVENVTFDSVITSADEIIEIDGYKYDSVDKDKITITTGENIINIYYTKKNDLSYTVNYLEKDTNKVLHDPKVVNNQTFETVITSADEVIEIDGYNYNSVDKDKITITTGENVINIYYTKKNDLSYTVNYLEKDTNKVLHDPKVTENVTFGDVIISSNEVIDIYGYNYDSVDKENITIKTSVEENVINIYYTKKDTSVIVHYYIEGTTDKVPAQDGSLVDDVTIEGKVFDEYETEEAENVSEKYELVKVPDNSTGTMAEDLIEVNYYYRLKDTSLIVKYLEKDTNKELAKQDRRTGKVDDEYTTTAKEIENYELVEDSGNTEGKLTVEPITVIYYYLQKTKVIVNHIDKNKLGDSDEIPEETLLAKEEEQGLVGDSYTSSAKDFEGYVLVEKPEQEIVTMTKDVIILNYYYVHVSAGVVEKHIDLNSNKVLDNTIYEGNEGDAYTTTSKEFEGYDIATNLQYYNYNYDALLEEYDEKTIKEVLNNPANDTMEKILVALKIDPKAAYIPKNATGTMTIDPIEVKYYYIRPASVRVEYIDKITGEKILEKNTEEDGKIIEKDSTVKIHGHEGDFYKAIEKDFEGYDIVKEEYPDNTEGEMKVIIKEDGTVESETVVKYYYVKKSAGVVERHYDIKTGKLLEKETKHEGHEGDPYSIKEKEFEGYDVVEEKLPTNAEGTMTVEQIVVNYYYIRKAQVIERHYDITTGKLLEKETKYEGHEGDEYKTKEKVFSGYELVEEKYPDNAEGVMQVIKKADGTISTETIVNYYYIRKAQVIERHIDEETGKLLEEATVYEGYEGDEYKTSSKEFKGYELNKEKLPENAEGTMVVTVKEDGTVNTTIIVNYYYKKIKDTEKPTETPKDDTPTDNNKAETIINNIYNTITNNPDTDVSNNKTGEKTPKTGDITLVITISTIALIILLNVIQLKAEKQEKCSRIEKFAGNKGKRYKK